MKKASFWQLFHIEVAILTTLSRKSHHFDNFSPRHLPFWRLFRARVTHFGNFPPSHAKIWQLLCPNDVFWRLCCVFGCFFNSVITRWQCRITKTSKQNNWITTPFNHWGAQARLRFNPGLVCFTETPDTKRAVKANSSFHDCIINFARKKYTTEAKLFVLVCFCACVYVCMYVCMYLCMYVRM